MGGGGGLLSSVGGAIGGVFNGVGGIFGKGGGYTDTDRLQDIGNQSYHRANDLEAQLKKLQPQESELAQRLADGALGQGPSIADAQLKMAQDRSLAQQLAATRANRSLNPALAQRMINQQSASAGQALAGQSAIAKMAEQQQQQAAFGNYLNQKEQGIRGYQQNAANAQANVMNQQSSNAARGDRIAGGIMNSGSDMLSSVMSDRNSKKKIKGYAEGGVVQPSSPFMDYPTTSNLIASPSQLWAVARQADGTLDPGVASTSANYTGIEDHHKSGGGGGGGGAAGMMSLFSMMSDKNAKKSIKKYAGGGVVGVDPGYHGLSYNSTGGGGGGGSSGAAPTEAGGAGAKTMAGGPMDDTGMPGKSMDMPAMNSLMTMLASSGGKVPGQPKVAGDSSKNDTVPAMLSPGELVIPRTVVAKGPEAVKSFAEKLYEKNCADDKGPRKMSKGGEVKSSEDGFDPKNFLDKLKAYSYEYKNPELPGAGEGRHLSVMAQDLEKAGPVGRSMVMETPQGKMVDYGKGFGAILAAQADLNGRLNDIESRYGKMK
jgi:hypothetical protein